MNLDKNKPIVIVITPSFNAETFLDETISSVVSQRGNFSIRYHVQDGGSSDNTVTILRKWQERLFDSNPLGGVEVEFSWQSEPDTGMYDALNRGFKYALSGFEIGSTITPILTWINADDIFLSNALRTACDYFTKNSQMEWITGVSTIMAESGTLADTSPGPRGFAQAALVAGEHDGRSLPFVQQEGTFFRHTLWMLAGGLSQNFRLAGDWDLWRRFGVHAELIKLRCVLAVHRRHSAQLSASMSSYYKEVDSAAPICVPTLNVNENAWLAIYDISTGTWPKYVILSKDLRDEATSHTCVQSKWERFDFGLTKLPAWIESISGLSGVESFGRWSDANLAPSVRIVTTTPLPSKFQLRLCIRTLSQEVNSPITIKIGTNCYQVNVADHSSKIEMLIDNACGANTIDITPAKVMSPLELGWSSDSRRLALGFESMTIDVEG